MGRQPCADSTWTPWLDVSNVEGANSCIKVLPPSFGDWTSANASCAAASNGSHLLTSLQVVQRVQGMPAWGPCGV
jgi:hypothetical protein